MTPEWTWSLRRREACRGVTAEEPTRRAQLHASTYLPRRIGLLRWVRERSPQVKQFACGGIGWRDRGLSR